jgi:hypothetical protein
MPLLMLRTPRILVRRRISERVRQVS